MTTTTTTYTQPAPLVAYYRPNCAWSAELRELHAAAQGAQVSLAYLEARARQGGWRDTFVIRLYQEAMSVLDGIELLAAPLLAAWERGE